MRYRLIATVGVLFALVVAAGGGGPGGVAYGQQSAPGGRLVISQIDESGELTSINPLGNHVPLPASLVYDTLVRRDPEGGPPQPRLATAVGHPDPTTWVLELREGVAFHDGSAFDAEDVAATLGWVLDEANGSGYRRFIATVSDIEVSDPRTVTLATAIPDALLADYLVQIPMLSAGQLEQGEDVWQAELLGTGPYRFEEWAQGERVVVTANPGYWDADAAPAWDEVVVAAVPEASTRLADLRAGQAGLVGDVLPEQVAQFEAAGATLVVEPAVNTAYLAFVQRPPFDDPLVRRAFYHAVDRAEIVGTLFEGYAEAAVSVVPEGFQGYVEAFRLDDHDPEEARALLEEAGVELPVAVTIDAPQDMASVAELVAAQAAEAGFAVDIQILPRSAVFDEARIEAAPGPRLIAITALDNRMFDAKRPLQTFLTSDAFVAAYGYEPDAGNDAAFAAYVGATDDAERVAASEELHASARDNPPAVWLYFPDLVYAVAEGVCWEPRGLGQILIDDIRPC